MFTNNTEIKKRISLYLLDRDKFISKVIEKEFYNSLANPNNDYAINFAKISLFFDTRFEENKFTSEQKELITETVFSQYQYLKENNIIELNSLDKLERMLNNLDDITINNLFDLLLKNLNNMDEKLVLGIKESIKCYKFGFYITCSKTLISYIETYLQGILLICDNKDLIFSNEMKLKKFTIDSNRNIEGKVKLLKEFIEKEPKYMEDEYLITNISTQDYFKILSLSNILINVFKDFQGTNQEIILNRNSLVHNSNEKFITKNDCLKLFILITSLSEFVYQYIVSY